ncbi:MAG TPA: class I SAM-dependent methyltransferase [Capillimicrobium sp.]|nr:class I SAM-dependent methyltransferase [Capillimicrobium sp.]
MSDLSEHAARNREAWDAYAARYQERHGPQLEASGGLAWGVWQLPEAELRILGDVAGLDVLELGCGAAQWSIGLARLGARVTGLDNSAAQLEHARHAIAAAGVDVELLHASAESVPLPDGSFDVVCCDHGAMTFADPDRTVPEAARLLRPGGLLAFSMFTPWAQTHWPYEDDAPGERLALDYFGMRRFVDPDDGMVTFDRPYGEWIALFGRHGLVVEALVELRPPADATSSYVPEAARDWARRWPLEHVWRARRPAAAA